MTIFSDKLIAIFCVACGVFFANSFGMNPLDDASELERIGDVINCGAHELLVQYCGEFEMISNGEQREISVLREKYYGLYCLMIKEKLQGREIRQENQDFLNKKKLAFLKTIGFPSGNGESLCPSQEALGLVNQEQLGQGSLANLSSGLVDNKSPSLALFTRDDGQ